MPERMLHFSEEEFALRLIAVEKAMAERDFDGLLVFDPESLYWLCGHDAAAASAFECLVLGGPEPVLLTGSEGARQARRGTTVEDVRVWPAGIAPEAVLARLLRDLGLGHSRIGLETAARNLDAARHARLAAAIAERARPVPAGDLVARLMTIKTESEIIYVRRAAELADDALDAATEYVGKGAAAAETVAAMLRRILVQGGTVPATAPSAEPLDYSAFGASSRTARTATGGNGLTLTWAGAYRHYHAAMMRSLMTGPVPPDLERLYGSAVIALGAAEAALRPGQSMGAVYEAQAASLDEMGLGGNCQDNCGHALGARLAPGWRPHEGLSPGNRAEIRPGMIFFLRVALTDPSGQWLVGTGRSLLVTAQGAEPLSRHGLDPVIV